MIMEVRGAYPIAVTRRLLGGASGVRLHEVTACPTTIILTSTSTATTTLATITTATITRTDIITRRPIA